MNKTLTVTVGITAKNEGRTISKLLKSIYLQKMDGFVIERIICISDGSKDDTVPVMLSLAKHNNSMQIVDFPDSLGKPTRLNYLYRANKSDILITIDADLILSSPFSLYYMVEPFRNNTIGLVGGNDLPIQKEGLIEEAIVAGIDMWNEARISFSNPNNIHNIHGALVGLSKSFASKIQLPPEVSAEDTYLFLLAQKMNYGFVFANDAQVRYMPSQNLHDYFIQHSRYISCRDEMRYYFPEADESQFEMPTKNKLQAIGKVIKAKPLAGILGIILNALIRLRKTDFKEEKSFSWKRAASTKGGALI